MNESETYYELQENAIKWFQGLDPGLKKEFVYVMYKLHLTLSENNADSLKKLYDMRYKADIEQLKKNSFMGRQVSSSNGSEQLDESVGVFNPEAHFEQLSKQIQELSNKLISNYTKGIVGENWVYSYMKELPNCIIKNVTHDKGLTDFYFELYTDVLTEPLNKKICGLIESKNVEKIAPIHIENFKNDVFNAIEDGYDINFAFFVAHRATSINGIEMEIYEENNKKVILFFIYDCFNNPDRVMIALNIAKTLTVEDRLPINIVKNILLQINSLDSNIKDQKRTINKMIANLKNSEINISNLYKIIQKNNDIPIEYSNINDNETQETQESQETQEQLIQESVSPSQEQVVKEQVQQKPKRGRKKATATAVEDYTDVIEKSKKMLGLNGLS